MAIIRSLAIGKARKSAGNVTYRTVRGRTIVSEKRGSATTRVVGLSRAQAVFGMVSMFMQAHASDIQVSFNKTRYGSERNYFFKTNKTALEAALATLVSSSMSSGSYPVLEDVESAITAYATANPNAIYRVKLDGFAPVMLSGAWSSADNPISGGSSDALGTGSSSVTSGSYTYSAPIALSLNFQSGARIVRDSGTVELRASSLPSGVGASSIQYLGVSGTPVSGLIVSDVTSSAGLLTFSSPSVAESQNVVGLSVGGIFVRLTSAYVRSGGSSGGGDSLD